MQLEPEKNAFALFIEMESRHSVVITGAGSCGTFGLTNFSRWLGYAFLHHLRQARDASLVTLHCFSFRSGVDSSSDVPRSIIVLSYALFLVWESR